MAKTEIYCMTDVEADGKAPGLSNMLSFATAAFDINKNLVGTFEANLELLPNATPNPETMMFWNSSPENQAAYAKTRLNLESPEDAINRYFNWLLKLPGTPIFVGYPAVYDFKWIDYYFNLVLDNNPFGFSRAIDVKTFAWSMLKSEKFQATSKRNMPKEWFDDLPHTHVAIDDAIEQGAMFINMLRAHRDLPRIEGIPGQ